MRFIASMKSLGALLCVSTLLVLGNAQGGGGDGNGGPEPTLEPYPGIPAPPYEPAQFVNTGMLTA